MNTLGRKRDRVIGPGPHRTSLPNFKKLCTMPKDVIDECLTLHYNHKNVNFLHGAKSKDYEIMQNCGLKDTIPERFQHILLQDMDDESSAEFMELKYQKWTNYANELPLIKQWLDDAFPNCYRARITILQPGELFGWHIDTNTSVACRVTCILNNADAVFEIDRRGEIEQMEGDVGDCIFTNIGWSHRVYNYTDTPRINLLFGIDYKEIEHYFAS